MPANKIKTSASHTFDKPTGLMYNHVTPLGIARITEQDGFIVSILIMDEGEPSHHIAGTATQSAIKQLDEYFEGKRLSFDLPLKPEGTTFQQLVWQQLQAIPYGKCITYLHQARLMNNPLAIRAIAAANGKNKIWIVVPCHRVIGSSGKLTGYAGGLWRKKWLLEHEAKIIGSGQISLGL
ncbi:methylated-DNA--[protein]-cysteine S-methyltransferase [Mucilaginibacter sp. PAMB04168]|uniref:methylated-DNA--[protein]-cysteine S-methyltransferase n=1 Tax=Mucilaginibacter sp. PAMB04168 TaxID=3138567 RepID=UPI0031F6161E